MKCPACNATNPDHATYCKSCGKALQSNLRKCPNGHDYDASHPSCPHCPPGRNQTMGAMPTARMGAETDKTRLDTANPKLNPGALPTTKPAIQARPIDDKTVILSKPPTPASASPADPALAPGSEKPHPQPDQKLVGWLVTFDLEPSGKDFQLRQGRHVIGRGDRCEIKLTVPGVSEEHAVLLCRNGKFIIEDRLSSNGTFVNGEMIEDKVYLNENDVIRIATVDLKLKTV